MSRWRIIVMALLIGLPFAVWALIGSIYLWRDGLSLQVWCPLAACMIAGYALGWYWQRQQKLLKPVGFHVPVHWTDRDRQAYELVELRASKAGEVEPAKLTDIQFYFDTARELADDLARFYHPKTQDPLSNLTVPEILAVIELAAHDLAEMVDQYVPGSHLLTIDHFRKAKKAVDLYPAFRNAYWLASAIFAPMSTGVRYTASELGMTTPMQGLQADLILWFYKAYLNRLGRYLVDLNSGRLRVGAERYRQLVKGLGDEVMKPAPPAADGKDGTAAEFERKAEETPHVTLLVTGQVKAGKSSFINAVLGEQRAAADVLPATAQIQRYELQPEGVSTRLVLLDSVGFGHEGPKKDQIEATRNAAREADLIVLVMHARNPGRQADIDLLVKLTEWFASKPELKMPPVLGVMTHIDLLSPALEWTPPYNWHAPKKPKEESIKEAYDAVREQLGGRLEGVVPVCVAPGKVYGIEEWFLPTLAELLDDAKAVALLRCLRAELDTGKVRRVFKQLITAGKEALKIYTSQPR